MVLSTERRIKKIENTPDYDKERNSDLLNVARMLVSGRGTPDQVREVLSFYAYHLGESPDGFTLDEEIKALTRIAYDDVHGNPLGITEQVREWVCDMDGTFSGQDVTFDLHIVTKRDKAMVRKALQRLKVEGVIRKVGSKRGVYARVEYDLEKMDFLKADAKVVDIWLPFGLKDRVEIMPGNVVIVAGSPNVGKTALMLNFIKENQRKFKVHYFNSEMGSAELRKRLDLFPDIALTSWDFSAWERSDNFADVIVPGEGNLNIIDFLEIHDDFYAIGGKIKDIWAALKGAIAIVCIQKNPGVDTGLGGYRTLEKPRLYLALDPGRLKIVKAKNWKGEENPNGQMVNFKLYHGCQFSGNGGWYRDTKKGEK